MEASSSHSPHTNFINWSHSHFVVTDLDQLPNADSLFPKIQKAVILLHGL